VDSNNVLKTVILGLQVCFTVDFVSDGSFKLCFCQFKFWQYFFLWRYKNFLVFFRLLDSKFNGDSKNVLKTIILSPQAWFTVDFVSDGLKENCVSVSLNFDTTFLYDGTKFCSDFSVIG